MANKKMAVVGVSSLILVAMVIAIVLETGSFFQDSSSEGGDSKRVKASTKAIKEICQPTDYKQKCIKSLTSVAGNDTTDPQQLIKLSFKVAIDQIKKALKESSLLKKAADDPRTSKALKNCNELMNYAIEDLNNSVKRFETFSIGEIEELIEDVGVWLSASMTYQETCLDGFEGAEGDVAKKMRKVLQGAHELTSNSLAIVTEISSVISSLGQPNSSRRLLSKTRTREDFPSWVSDGRRKLLEAHPKIIKPDVVVAKDGSGDFKTITSALRKVPKKSRKNFVIYIKKGTYTENVTVERSMQNVVMIGDGQMETKISGRRNFIDGTPTFKTATVAVLGDGFTAKNIGFENTAGPTKHQAVALRVQSDRSVFYRCQMDGYQDTLYTHTNRQFYRECTITGTIDFIFGNAAVVLQNCKILARKPLDNQRNIVTAQGRKDRHEPTAIIIHNCTISAEPTYYPLRTKLPTYLGRPWKERSRTLIFQSEIDDLIHPDGWLPWNAAFALSTCFYSEFDNRGAGSPRTHRVKWRCIKNITEGHAQEFTVERFIRGDQWIKASGVPFTPGLLPLHSHSSLANSLR